MNRSLSRALLFSILWLTASVGQEIPGTAPETAEPAPEISVQDAPGDAEIQRRLSSVLSQIESLESVKVSIRSGVATLSGEVPNARASRSAEEIANRTEGVVHVQNQLEEIVDLEARLRPATRKVRELGAAAVRILPVAAVALLVAVVAWFLGIWAGNRETWLRRLGLSELAANLGRRVVRTVVTLGGFLIALEILDATAIVSALLGVAGVAGIALGFAFRNIVENYLAGVLLSARNPFAIGDQVKVGEFLGNVIRLASRDTVLMTPEGNHLRIPNSVIITSPMTNFTRNPLRRFEFTVGVAVDADLLQARRLGVETLRRMPGVLADPPPQAAVTSLGESSVLVLFMAWIDQRETDFLKAKGEGIRFVKTAFDEARIEMPEPIYRVVLNRPSSKEESAAPSGERPAATAEDVDVSADHTLDKQVAEDLETSGEENLLNKGPA